MNIYWRELRVNQKGLVIWTASLSALGFLVLALYPTVQQEAQLFDQLLQGFPPGFLTAFGLDKISFTSLLGYYATKQYLTIALAGSIYAALLGSSILSKEESEHTIEFLLSKPVTRATIVSNKLLVMASIIVLFNLGLSLLMYFSLLTARTDFEGRLFWLLCLGGLLLHLTFAALSLLLSVLLRRGKTPVSLALGLVLATYGVSIVTSLSSKLSALNYFSPFKYVDPIDILSKGRIEGKYLLLMAFINVAAVLFTYVIYKRKDIIL